MAQPTAIAIAAHPDDIEFQMAGTLLLLKQAGYETHYLNLAGGDCGSTQYDGPTTRAVRKREARSAAQILGARFHAGLTDDLLIFYNEKLLRRLSAIVREVKPTIVLTHSPQDYMEDHMNTCRLAVTAVFARGMPNFKTRPSRAPFEGESTLYHAMPVGLCDPLRRRVVPEAYVNTTSVQKTKLEALSAHQSQQHWLETSQGLNSYLLVMEETGLELGRWSGKFRYAEGWRRHLHFGFCSAESDPLRAALGRNYLVNSKYERNLKKGL